MDNIHKIAKYQVKQVGDESDRTLRFIGTDESEDRDGDIIKADGAQLENFLKNPVFLQFHYYDSVPIGKCVNISHQASSLLFDIKFASIEELSSNPDLPSDEAQDADTIYMAYKNGYMSAVSIGFIGVESEEREDQKELPAWQRGRIFTQWELLELSAVAVPSNPNALIQARSAKKLNPEQIKRLEKIIAEKKGAIPYKKFPLAEEDAAWDAGAVVKEADTDDLKVICAWFDSENPDVKGSYKLPHHLGAADGHKTVWKGVAAAMAVLLGARGGVNVPEADKQKIYAHLKKHYLEFEKEVPDFKSYTAAELKQLFNEDENMKPQEVAKAIADAIEPLQKELKILRETKAGAKISASTMTELQKCMDHMTKGYEGMTNAQATLKALMQGDDSEPDGQSTTETTPQIDVDGDVDASGGKTIDISKMEFKNFGVSRTETVGGQKND